MIADTSGALAVSPVLIPLAGAALSALARRRQVVQRGIMEATVAFLLLASLVLVWTVAAGDVIVVNFGGWGAPFGITFVADRLGAALAATTGVVAVAVGIFARADIRTRRRRAGFDALFLAMLAAVNGAFLTGDIFNLYVWFELMLVCAVGLITLDRRKAQLDGAFRYTSLSMMGATFMLLGIGLLYAEAGTLDMVNLGEVLSGRPPTVALSVSAFLLLAGFALKAGLFPFFFWLPASYHTAPISVSAALAGLLTKVAFYACLRVFVLVFGAGSGASVVQGIGPAFALLAAGTMTAAIFAAIAQTDVRRLLSFHVMCQVAYLMMGLAILSLLGIAAAIFYMVHTMLVQTGLFLGAGAIARANRSYDLRRAGGLMRDRPFFAAMFALLAFSISGVPPLSGFWAKFLVIDAALRLDDLSGAMLALVAIIVSFLTLYSMSKLWTQAFWKTPMRDGHAARVIPGAMVWSVGILAMCTLVIGLAPDFLLQFAREAAVQIVPGVQGVLP